MTMTTQEKRKLAGWIVGAILLPLGVYGFKKFEASKVDAHEFALYVNAQLAKEELRTLRDSARQAETNRQLKYISCRLDFQARQCAHLR